MKSIEQLEQEIITRFSRYKGKIGVDLAVGIVKQEFDGFEKEPRELLKDDVAKEFVDIVRRNARRIHEFVTDGETQEIVVPLDLAIANYANTEHVLNKVKEIFNIEQE